MLNFMLVFAAAAPAPEPTNDLIGWGLGLVKWVVEQFASKNYAAAVAGIVMAIVFVLKLVLKDKLAAGQLPLVSAGVGLLLAVATSLSGATPDMSITSVLGILFAGLTTGAMASGFWSLVGKHVVNWVKAKFAKKEEAPAPAVPPTEPPAQG